MMPAGNMPMFFAGCVWPCLLACAAVFNWTIAVGLFTGITFGWWARDRLGAVAATVEAEVVSNASSASPAGAFAGVYWDPQAKNRWEIQDACAVTAVREWDQKKVRGWIKNSVLTLRLRDDRDFEARLQDRQLVWLSSGAKPWEQQ